MANCKLKKGDRIFECRYREATLVELVTDPELVIQKDNSHYWHWKARVVAIGELLEYGITEESPQYGPRLFRNNLYEAGPDKAQPILPPFEIERDTEILMRCVSINDDIEILGTVFHGLQDIEAHVEMSLYKDYSHGQANEREPKICSEVHVGEMWMPYPCFDSDDFMYENRTYQNYIFRSRPITQSDMKALSELPSGSNECRITENLPQEIIPLVYYAGDGDTMLVVT